MPAHKPKRQFFPSGRVTQYFLASIGLAACLVGLLVSGRTGISRLLGLYGMTSNVLPAVNEAVRLSPFDPEGHYMRARVLQNAGQISAALAELERATTLQPRNFGLWMELGGSYDLAGKPDEAIAATTWQSKRLPITHKHTGNLAICYLGRGVVRTRS